MYDGTAQNRGLNYQILRGQFMLDVKILLVVEPYNRHDKAFCLPFVLASMSLLHGFIYCQQVQIQLL